MIAVLAPGLSHVFPRSLKPASLLNGERASRSRGERAVACWRWAHSRVRWLLALSTQSCAMAHKHDAPTFDGLIREAMAFRVKYRLKDEKGVPRKTRKLHLEQLCICKDNRGGQYPNPDTVIGLGIGIFTEGFSLDEANHQGVCVQEIPVQHQTSIWTSQPYLTMRDWNISKCFGTQLQGCFPSDADCTYGTLAHGHLLLTLLCWVHGLKWPVPSGPDGKPVGDKWPLVLGFQGELNKDAVVSVDEGYSVLEDGLAMEVLSWEIHKEKGACSKISQALNKGQSVALRTTEMTALAVLNGAIGLALLSNRVTSTVSWEMVQEKVRTELDIWVDDPDFIEAFDYVINLGATKNTFVSGLLEWAEVFVDSKLRQLRLTAYGEANKLPIWAPRLKRALIQRAYRKTPINGYCPGPEPFWAKASDADLEKIEQLLFYFQVTCLAFLSKLDKMTRMDFETNVTIATLQAYAAKKSKMKLVPALLQGTKIFHDELLELVCKADESLKGEKLPDPGLDWIDYSAVVEKKTRRGSP